MTGPERSVWVSGDRIGVYHLYGAESGKVLMTARLPPPGRKSAGGAKRCLGRFVAVYVDPERRGLVLQIGRKRFPLGDGSTTVESGRRLGGLLSTLRLSHPVVGSARAGDLTVGRAVLSRVDPTYDELDESCDDFLGELADIASNPRRQEWFMHVKDPFADPTEPLELPGPPDAP